jgi:hypothetical protein
MALPATPISSPGIARATRPARLWREPILLRSRTGRWSELENRCRGWRIVDSHPARFHQSAAIAPALERGTTPRTSTTHHLKGPHAMNRLLAIFAPMLMAGAISLASPSNGNADDLLAGLPALPDSTALGTDSLLRGTNGAVLDPRCARRRHCLIPEVASRGGMDRDRRRGQRILQWRRGWLAGDKRPEIPVHQRGRTAGHDLCERVRLAGQAEERPLRR